MNTKKEFFPIAHTIIMVLALSLICGSCKDKDDPKPNPKYSKLTVIHAAANVPDIDFYADKKVQNTKPFSYKTHLDYFNVESGKTTFNLSKHGKTQVLVKGEYTLTQGRYYSLFITDTIANSMLLIHDDLTAAMPDHARIRFINVSPDGGNVDLAVTGKTEPIIAGKSFREFSDFINTPEIGKDIAFEIREHGTGILLYQLSKMKLSKGKDYTFYARGIKGGLGNQAFELSYIVNR